jgi:hypothetical protein
MAPTDRTSFPVLSTVAPIGESLKHALISGNNLGSFTVGATAVKAGQVVSISATGLDWTVIPCIAEAGSQPIGVAVTDAAIGGKVSVAMIGCICWVSNYASDVDIDAGERLTWNDAAPGGTVILSAGAPTLPLVGRALGDDDASNLELFPMLVLCGAFNTEHA